MTHRLNEHTIPLFLSPYDVFSGKLQMIHFVLFRNVRLCGRGSIVQISLSLQEIVCLHILMARLALGLLEIVVAVANRSFFDSLSINLSSLVVIFLNLSGSFLASQNPVFSSFLKILWITLLDFPTVFEISYIESLSLLSNLTISFLSSNNVTDFFTMFTKQELL